MSTPVASCATGQALPSFYYGSRTKPLLALEALFSAFRPASAPFELARESNYHFRPDQADPGVIMLEEGMASICHGEKQMVVTPLFSPSILGFMNGYGLFDDIPHKRHYVLFAETDLRGRWISHQAAVDILNEQNLWRHVTHILAQRLMVLSMREQELIGVDSYLMVRTLLMELADYPENYRKKNQRIKLYSPTYQPVAQPHNVDSFGAAQRRLYNDPPRRAGNYRPSASRQFLSLAGEGHDFSPPACWSAQGSIAVR